MGDHVITRRQLLVGATKTAAVVGTAPLVAACGGGGGSSGSSGIRTLSVALPSTLTNLNYSPVLVARAAGFFKQEGLDVHLTEARSSFQALQQVLTGNAAVGYRIEALVQCRAVAESKAATVAIATEAPQSPYFIVSPSSAPVRSLAELRGKTLGLLSLGGGSDETITAALKLAGLDAGSVKKVASGSTAAAFAFLDEHRSDAIVAIYETIVTLKAQGKHFSSFNVSGVNPVLGELVVVSRDTLARRRTTLVRFLRAVGKAMDSVLADKDLDRTLGRLRGVDIPILQDASAAKATLRQVSQAWIAAGRDNLLRSVPAQWTANVRRLESTGVLKARVDPSRIYTNAVVQEARG